MTQVEQANEAERQTELLHADRERRKRARERREQIPEPLRDAAERICRGRWQTAFSVALNTALDYRLGETEIRRLIAEGLAADARGLSADPYIELTGLPFRDFPVVLIAETQARAVDLRNRRLAEGALDETAGIFDRLRWPPLSHALQLDANYSVWKLSTSRVLGTIFYFRKGDTAAKYWDCLPGLNILPNLWRDIVLNRRDVAEWLEEGWIQEV